MATRAPASKNLLFSRRAALAGIAGAPALAACSGVSAFNALTPTDADSALIASDIAFGQDARHRLDIYAPTNFRTPAPVVQFIYGGSWSSGSRSDYAFAGRALSSQGFVTVIADYRLVPEVRFPDFLDDSARAIAWTLRNIGARGGDASRVVVMGHSSGAYNAMMLALDPRYLARHGVSANRLRGAIGLSGPYDFLPLDVDATKQAFGQWPRLNETQPVNFARRDASPSFLATGDADTTVYPRNTIALAKKLRGAGAPVTEKIYPGIGHAGLVTALAPPYRGRAAVLSDVTAFIRQVTRTA